MSPVLDTGLRASTTKRIALWDNARFIMMALIVVDHALATARLRSDLALGIYTFPFFLHIPVIMLIAGYFAKPTVNRKSVRAVLSLVAAWVLWEAIWALIRAFVAGKTPGDSFLISPAWTLWFLLTLATLRVLLPYVLRLRYPIITSVVIALAAGCSPAIGSDFSVSRTLCLLPFFVTGWLIRDRGWLSGHWFTQPSIKLRIGAWVALAVFAFAVLLVSVQTSWRLDMWLRWDQGYQSLFDTAPIGDLTLENWWGMALVGAFMRLLLLSLSAVLSLAVLIIVPRGKSTLTGWGTRTLYVYLLHAPLIWLLREWGVMGALGDTGAIGVLVLIAIGLLLAAALSTKWVKSVTRPVIEPRLRWLMNARV